MEMIFSEEVEEEEIILDTKYLKYGFKNGYIDQMIRNKYDLKTNVHSSFTYNEISVLIFIFILLIRIIISLSISDGNNEFLMYFGRFWHLMDLNYIHGEVLFLLWTINIIAIPLYIIHSPDKHYKWLQLFAFLFGIIPHKSIGKSFLILFLFVIFLSVFDNFSFYLCIKIF
jgi:hypothetical protein